MNRRPPEQDPHDDAVDEALVVAALERVRAADPAVDAVLDTDSLHGALAGSTGVAVPGDELAAARSRRRSPRWLQAAAAVAAVAVIGTGGYALGAAGDGTGGGSDVALEPAMSLDRGDSAADAGAAEIAGGAGVEGSATSLAGRDAYFWYGGHTVFHASGLSTSGGSHAAWGFDPRAAYGKAGVEAAAAVLGVSGKAREDASGWTVGKQDGSAPTVTVMPDGTASLSFYDPTRDPWCSVDSISPPDTPDDDGEMDVAGGGAEPASGDGGTCTGEAPSDKVALGTAKDTLTGLGLDVADYTWDASDDGGAAVNVSAELVVDGQRTGQLWWFSVMSDGVQSAYGPLAPVVDLGTYDVVSPAQAVERLNDPRFGASGGGVYPLAARSGVGVAEELAVAPEEPVGATTPPAAPEPGGAFSWPVQQVTIVDSRLGVATHTGVDGTTSLIPTYELTDANGSTWTVVAVVDDQLDLAG